MKKTIDPLLRLTPDRMGQGGVAIARHQGRVIFIQGALPGETVDVAITTTKKNWSRGQTKQLLNPAPQRVAPKCAHYALCGGCNLQHVSYDFQCQLAQQQVNEQLQHHKISVPDWQVIGSPPWGWRNRARFQVLNQKPAFYQAGSHTKLTIDHCPVLTAPLNQWLATADLPKKKNVNVYEAHGQLVTDLEPGRFPPTINTTINGKTLSSDATVFFQSNLGLLPTLVDWTLGDHQGQVAVDLYSGVGTFSAFLQDRFEQVITLEKEKRCLFHARKNLGNRVSFITADASQWLKNSKCQKIDLLLVDPPRTGLAPPVIASILQAAPQQLTYVSCDPVTLVRDLTHFCTQGYQVTALRGFDFYPQTHHLEMVVKLRRK